MKQDSTNNCLLAGLTEQQTKHIIETTKQVCDGYYYARDINNAIKKA